MNLSVQVIKNRPESPTGTTSATEWLKADDHKSHQTSRWQMFIKAAWAARHALDVNNGLRDEPRIGFDPGKNQIYVYFVTINKNVVVVSTDGFYDIGDDLVVI